MISHSDQFECNSYSYCTRYALELLSCIETAFPPLLPLAQLSDLKLIIGENQAERTNR